MASIAWLVTPLDERRQAGDFVAAMPDGYEWSDIERGCYCITELPGMPVEDANAQYAAEGVPADLRAASDAEWSRYMQAVAACSTKQMVYDPKRDFLIAAPVAPVLDTTLTVVEKDWPLFARRLDFKALAAVLDAAQSAVLTKALDPAQTLDPAERVVLDAKTLEALVIFKPEAAASVVVGKAVLDD